MPLTPGEQYGIMFPSPLDAYLVTVKIKNEEAIPVEHFLLELEAPNDGNCYKLRTSDEHAQAAFSLCSNGQYYLQTQQTAEAGECTRIPGPESVLVISHPIPVDTAEEWVDRLDGVHVIMLYFSIVDCGQVDITDLMQPVTAEPHDGSDAAGNAYVAAFPAAALLPRGPDEKKMARRKVKVIWKEDL